MDPKYMTSMVTRIALHDIAGALSAANVDDRCTDAVVALDGFEQRIDLLGLSGATTVLRHRASASRAHRIELRDLRTVKLAMLTERADARRSVSR